MNRDKWQNRRRMAWLSMLAGLAFPLLLLATDSDQLGAIAGPFYVFVGAIVGAYFGFATIDDKWEKQGDLNVRHQNDASSGTNSGNNGSERGSVNNE